jgi:hypothetical protein
LILNAYAKDAMVSAAVDHGTEYRSSDIIDRSSREFDIKQKNVPSHW